MSIRKSILFYFVVPVSLTQLLEILLYNIYRGWRFESRHPLIFTLISEFLTNKLLDQKTNNNLLSISLYLRAFYNIVCP